jgi:hypothetical protein
MSTKYLVGSCILVGGLLLKAGVPPVSIALGIVLAAVLHWRRQRRAS